MPGDDKSRGPRPVDLVLDHATVATVARGQGPLAGAWQSAVDVVHDAAIAVADGRLAAVGVRSEVLPGVDPVVYQDLAGRAVVPGFVDAHSHLVWAGSRIDEFEQRLRGATYLEIMASGGGIATTVRASRAATPEALLASALARLDGMMMAGTTTCEAKTGYGLSTDEELRQLAILAEADARHPVHVVPTFLGAHAVPEEWLGRADEYIAVVCEEMLPAVARRYPHAFCDVFCDEGAFTLEQAARVLGRARELGLRLKAHSDEFACLGCTSLAANHGATSVDHLVATTPSEMAALAASGTVAVLLPGTTFGLGGNRYADGRAFVERQVPVALGTDFNPGTCPCLSMPFILALACRYLGLTPAEALVAATRNAAYACGLGETVGRLAAGWAADLVVLEASDYRELAYWIAPDAVSGVMIGGVWRRPLGAARYRTEP